MSQTVIRNANVLKFLAKATPNQRKAVLNTADKNLIHCLCECVHNIIRGNVPLTKHQKQKLAPHKNKLRNIVRKDVPLKKKRQILTQKGGAFLPLILAPLISGVLSSLFK